MIRKIILTIMLVAILSFSTSIVTIAQSNYENENIHLLLSAPPAPVRQPAEFEPMEGVLIRYPFGISYQIIAEMSEDVEVVTIVASSSEQTYVYNQYQSQGVNTEHCSFLIAHSDTHWTRDYGPWFIINGDGEQGISDHTYNRPTRPNDNLIPLAYGNWQGLPVYSMNLVHTGGNYMTDGQGIAISTDLVWTENPGYTHEQIDQIVEDYLGITTYHVVPDALGAYIEHIDCWAKLLAPDKIMIIETSPAHSHYNDIENAVQYFENQISCYGTPYEIYRVYTHLLEPYINSLILNDKMLIPIKGSQYDDEAILAYENAMPGYEVLGFTGSWSATDALHCRAMGITDRDMLYIEHIPIYGEQSTHDGFEIIAKIIPYSDENLVTSSTGVYWKTDSGNWNFEQMQPIGDDYYQAEIPPQQTNTNVYYYIHAEDNSGRIENHPYIGEPDPHDFTAILLNNAPDAPEINGPTSGKVGIEYQYNFTATDPEADQIYLWVEWGDQSNSQWIGPFESDEKITLTHTYNERGEFTIEAKAKDIFDDEGPWGTLEISIPRNRLLLSSFLLRIFQRFPQIFQVITNIFK